MKRAWILSALAAGLVAMAGTARSADPPAPPSTATAAPAAPADAAFERGLALFDGGKFREASAAFIDCANQFPKADLAGKAKLYAGLSVYRAGDYRQAIDRFQECLKADPHDAEAQLWLGRAYMKDNQAAAAAKCFEEVVRIDPDSSLGGDALLGLGDAQAALGKWDEAAAAYEAFVKQFPDHPNRRAGLWAAAAALHRAGRYEESDACAKLFLQKGLDDDLAPQVLFISGENRFRLKDYAAAADRYRVLAETRADAPEAPAARVRLAWAEFFQNDFDAALLALDRLDPRRADKAVQAEAEYLRGNCLLEKKDNERAAEAFGRYAAAPAGGRYRDDALLRQAVALARAGKAADAAGRFEAFLRQAPASPLVPEVEYQLAETLLAAGGRENDAIAHYQTVIARFGDHRLAPCAAYGIALAQLKKGSPADAADAFGRMAERYPQSDLAPQALYQKAVALGQAGRAADARAAFQVSLDRYPDGDLAPASMLGLGMSLRREKQYSAAADVFRRLEAAPTDAKIDEAAAYELGWSLQQAGRDREAADAWQALAQKFPTGTLAADAYYQLAEAPYRGQKFAEAAALYEKALAALRDGRLKDRILYRLGWSRRGEGQWAEAAACFDRLLAETPESDLVAEATLAAGDSHLQAGRPAEAIVRLARLADPKFKDFARAANARLRLGEAQILLGRSEDAVTTLTALEQAWPGYKAMADVQFSLGKALYDLKRYEQARQRLEKAAAMTKTETAAKAQFYIGETHLAAGDPSAALRTYQKVVSAWGSYKEWAAAAQFEIGQCYRMLEQPAEARAAFQAIVDKYGDTKWAEPARAAVARPAAGLRRPRTLSVLFLSLLPRWAGRVRGRKGEHRTRNTEHRMMK